jgi:hypothetical protein
MTPPDRFAACYPYRLTQRADLLMFWQMLVRRIRL